MQLHYDKTIENIDYSSFKKGEYDNCTFVNCNFVEADLSHSIFTDCTFKNCDLSNAKIQKTQFNDVRFSACKMLGLAFEKVEKLLLTFGFDTCQLDFSSFYELKIKKTKFINCSLKSVDFGAATLTASDFSDSNLDGAIFEQANLEQVDFRTALNFSIIPTQVKLKGARFSKCNCTGLLQDLNLKID